MLLPESQSTQPSWPGQLHLDSDSIPKLPPPASSRGHNRSRTTIDIPPLLSRNSSHSPTRSTTFLPFLGPSRSSSPKRTSPAEAAEFAVEDVENCQSRRKSTRKVENLASWFEGSSSPVNIGLVASSKEQYEGENKVTETIFSNSQESLSSSSMQSQQRPMMQSNNSSTSKFNFFSRRSSVVKPKLSPDDLACLNITDALFPDGPADQFSPAAFKNLQQNAEGLLRIFQAAYSEQAAMIRKITSEKNIQADELEASTTRNEHLKAQLLEMAERNSQHEKLIASLQAENEKLTANESALRSIRVITDYTSPDRPITPTGPRPDLPRRNRSSDVSFAGSDDSASTDLSSSTSIFSSDNDDCDRSPGTSIGCPSPTIKQARVINPSIQHSPHIEHLRSLTTHIVMPDCQNCHGVRPHEAWEVIGVMKAENAGLKEQILALENSHDSAMDLLTWMPVELNDLTNKCQRVLNVRENWQEEL